MLLHGSSPAARLTDRVGQAPRSRPAKPGCATSSNASPIIQTKDRRTASVERVARSARSRSGANDLRASSSAYPEGLIRSPVVADSRSFPGRKPAQPSRPPWPEPSHPTTSRCSRSATATDAAPQPWQAPPPRPSELVSGLALILQHGNGAPEGGHCLAHLLFAVLSRDQPPDPAA
jgi:hypothetical protein